MKDPYISYFTDLPKEPTDFSRQQERELDVQVGANDIKKAKKMEPKITVQHVLETSTVDGILTWKDESFKIRRRESLTGFSLDKDEILELREALNKLEI